MNLEATMKKINFDINLRYEFENVDTSDGLRSLAKLLLNPTTNSNWEDECFKKDYQYTYQVASVYWKIVNLYLNLDNIDWTFLDDEEEAKKVLKKFINNIVATHKYYCSLIATQEEALLKMTYSLESSSEQRFNDSPDSEGDYSTDKYTTNITKVTQHVAQNPIDVYEAKKRALENLYNNWMKDILKGIVHYE